MPTPPLTTLPPLGARTSTWLTHEGQPVLGERHLAILELTMSHKCALDTARWIC